MIRLALSVLALSLAVSLALACSRADGAVEPVWGKQPCAHCAMVLSDRRFGAELLTVAGDRAYFDDVGCMVLYLEEHPGSLARSWVHDGQTGRWLDARAARYAPAAASPMDYGFEARAEGDVGWDAMRERVIAKQRSQK
jgi:copper chaperone NosL